MIFSLLCQIVKKTTKSKQKRIKKLNGIKNEKQNT